MKIHAMSDLHLEHGDIKLPGGDILVLAGDIWIAAAMPSNRNDALLLRLRQRFARFADEELSKYNMVIVIAGNHEHYGSCIDDTNGIIKDFCRKVSPRIVVLNNENAIIDGIAFIGSTMWATYGGDNAIDEIRIKNRTNDCRAILTLDDPKDAGARFSSIYRSMRPSDFYKIHERDKKVVLERLEHNSDKPCVLITHHAATYAAGKIDPHWGMGLGSAYYSNFLDLAVQKHPNIIAAIHGHTHNKVRFEHEGVLVISNPRGYVGRERIADEFEQDEGTFEVKEGKVVG